MTGGVIGPLWQALGHQVIALAVAGRTAQQAGHDAHADLARTIDGLVASVEHGGRQLDESTVLVVDEAAQIDHSRYAALLEVAAQAGAVVIQVGDDRQLSPVGPGGLWTLIHAAAQTRGLAAELRTVRRAKEAAEAKAWTDVREGRVVEALRHWQERGRLRLYDSRSDLQAGMVAEWWADAARGVMVLDTSNAERDVINRLAQEQRGLAGELGTGMLTLDNGCQVRIGDHVIFREITELPARVPRIENGTEATVTRVDAESGQVELLLHEPHGERTVWIGRAAVLNLAYARHIQLGQGMTVEGAGQVGVSSRTDREHFYVMVSRAKAGAVIHALRSEIAALAAPGLGRVTERQQAALERLGVSGVPEDWTWADASVELDALSGSPLGGWAMRHLTETMQVEMLLAAHLVAQAIARRVADTGQAVTLDDVAPSVRLVVAGQLGDTDWEVFLAELQAHREALEAVQRLARSLSREGRKEAIGDQPLTADQVPDEARHLWRDGVLVKRDSRPADVQHTSGRSPHDELEALPLPPREPDLIALRFADGIEVSRGQVVRFGHPDWLAGAARREVAESDLGVVLGCHRGGVTWDYVTVELVGGRRIEVWQSAQAITVEDDLTPSVVRDAVPRPDQRDPAALNVFELINGVRLMVDDRVRFVRATALPGAGWIDAGTWALVREVERHRHNRAVLELEDGRPALVYPTAELELVQPAQAPTAPLPGTVASDPPVPAAGPQTAARMLERVARWEVTDQLPRALAMYDALGKLSVSTNPAEEVARLWLADPQATIVVQTWAQVATVREAIAQAAPDDVPSPLIMLADPAHRSRVKIEKAGQAAPAFERAYVVAELDDRDALSRALSVARESHLVIEPPDELTARLQAMHARQIAMTLETAEADRARSRDARQAALASERYTASQRRSQETEPERTAERDAAPS